MSPLTRCVVLWVLMLWSLHSSRGTQYLVIPNDFGSCSGNIECVHFEEFLQNSSIFITSNSTVEFLPDRYEIDTAGVFSIDIIKVTNVTISTHKPVEDGNNQRAEIHCNTNFKVVWRILQSENIHIENMAMIGCSAQVNVTNVLYIAAIQPSIDTVSTLLLAKVTNIVFIDTHVSSSNGTILLGIDIEENLHILNCKLNGTVQMFYPSDFASNIDTYICIEDSEIIPGIHYTTRDLYQDGISMQLPRDVNDKINLLIKNSSFYGYSGIYGYLLTVEYNPCSSFAIQLVQLYSVHGGMSISGTSLNTCSYSSCHDKNRVNIENSVLTQMSSRSRLDILGILDGDTCLTVTISDSTFSNSGAAISLRDIPDVTISNTTFINNTNALKSFSSTVHFQNDVNFMCGTESYQGFSAILLQNSDVYFKGLTVIQKNSGGKHAAVIAKNSTLFFEGEVHFRENQGFYGGALSMYEYSIINMKDTSKIVFIDNHAWKSGGAIYVDSSSYKNPGGDLRNQCFYFQSGTKYCNKRHRNLYFCNNTSVQGGDSVYGGAIDLCYLRRSTSSRHNPRIYKFDFNCIAEFCDSANSRNSLQISSNPIRLCFCSNSELSCDDTKRNVTVIPGETIELSVMAVGQMYGVTIATVRASLMTPYSERRNKVYPHISQIQTRQEVYRQCTKLQYTVYAPVGNQKLILATQELTNDDIIANTEFHAYHDESQFLHEYTPEVPLSIDVTLETCSLGFIFNEDTLGCECHPHLEQKMIHCVIHNQTIIRSGYQWVNATNNSISISEFCPLGYCNTENMELSLSRPDTQCSFDRSGTLCGQCRGNLSQVLGSLNCKECSDFWLFLVIPATLISGVVLVLFLMTLNLTVSTGTINGLIFYANIIGLNTIRASFFSSQTNTITNISRVFIAWINLDLGIEVCFYNGLDAYAKTLFQLAFPLYICTIVAIIIISSHYSTLAAKLSGRNAVQVLATLFLLSYSKAIRLVITALSFTNLTIQHYPNNTNTSKPVWIYDGNVDYRQGRHIALFLIGILILVLVSLPYTTILLFSQCLQKISHYKGMSWVWKIKPLFDAYTGPYKNKHRYWTGLLLLVRVILYAIFSLNFGGDPSFSLLTICSVMFVLLIYLVLIGQVYKTRLLNIIECIFMLNLALLSAGTLYALHTERIDRDLLQELIINISVIVSFIVFCGVLILHTYKRVVVLKVTNRYIARFKKKSEQVSDNVQEKQEHREKTVTRQVVFINDLEEPLIEMHT